MTFNLTFEYPIQFRKNISTDDETDDGKRKQFILTLLFNSFITHKQNKFKQIASTPN